MQITDAWSQAEAIMGIAGYRWIHGERKFIERTRMIAETIRRCDDVTRVEKHVYSTSTLVYR